MMKDRCERHGRRGAIEMKEVPRRMKGGAGDC